MARTSRCACRDAGQPWYERGMWTRRALAVGIVVVGIAAGLVRARGEDGGGGGNPVPASPAAPSLAGTAWHTRGVEGPLFFVIREVGVKFGADGTFRARVLFVDEEKTERSGTYVLEGPDHMTLSISGLAPQKLRYWRDGKDVMLRDEAHDVTARFVPGPMTETGWF